MKPSVPDNLIMKINKAFERSAPHEALEYLRKALKSSPGHPLLLLRTGIAFHLMKRYGDAEAYYIKAGNCSPPQGEAYNNLGKLYLETGRTQEAVEAFRQAAELLPSVPMPLTALATALQRLKLIREAENVCSMVIDRFPDCAEAHHTRALMLLLQGNYRDGWLDYEWRWETNRPPFRKRTFSRPLWHGDAIPGKQLLVHSEQGLGDTIQFCRYLPLVAASSQAGLIVECHPALHRLLSARYSELRFIPPNREQVAYDCHFPLLSLPALFSTTLGTIPFPGGYLSTLRSCSDELATLINNACKGLKVGICWSGNSYPDPGRSCPFEFIQRLFECDTVTFYSLQVDNRPRLDPDKVIDLAPHIHDFADTAAAIEQLDLVITIDTSIAHLAGAIGKATWVLLPYVPDWRWGLEGDSAPWYSSVKLYRQSSPADWNSIIQKVTVDLKRLSGEKNSSVF